VRAGSLGQRTRTKGERAIRIIDAHHHLWDLEANHYPWLTDARRDMLIGDPAPIAKNYLLADFLKDAARQNVVKSVHLEAGHSGGDPVRETAWLQAIADDAASGGFPHAIVAHANFGDPWVEEHLERHRQHRNVRGIRHIVNRHPDPVLNFADRDYLADPTWRKNFGLLKKHDLSFDLQLYPAQMDDGAALARENPDIQIILNHTGMPIERDPAGYDLWRRGMETLAACPNIAVKISGLGMLDHHWTVQSIRPFVLGTIDLFGIERCAFASNFPVDSLMSDYDTLWNAFKTITADFSEHERDALFHDNAARLYRI
jgi:predicted TIM-barrel fold metal-dependent hydrolase